jgi:hypothetical protein
VAAALELAAVEQGLAAVEQGLASVEAEVV